MQIIDADREAAEALRVLLAGICGFWHKPGDDGPLCIALARHRIEAERRSADRMRPIKPAPMPPRETLDFRRLAAPVPAAATEVHWPQRARG